MIFKHYLFIKSLVLISLSLAFLVGCGGVDDNTVNANGKNASNGTAYSQPAKTLGGGIIWYTTKNKNNDGYEIGDLRFPNGVVVTTVKHYFTNAPDKLVYTNGSPSNKQYYAFPDGTVMNWSGLQLKKDGTKVFPHFGTWTLSADATVLTTSFGYKAIGGTFNATNANITFSNGLILNKSGNISNSEAIKNPKNVALVGIQLAKGSAPLTIGNLPPIFPSGDISLNDGSKGKVKSISAAWIITLEDGRIFMPDGNEGKPVSPTLQGKWLQLHDNKEIFIGAYSDLIYSKVDNNTLNVTVGKNGLSSANGILTEGMTYTIVKAGIDQVNVSGTLTTFGAPFATGALTTQTTATNAVTLVDERDTSNTIEATVGANGRFQMIARSGNYRLQATNAAGQSVDARVRVERNEIDLGTFTLTDSSSYNFKASIVDPEFTYFAAKKGQNATIYDLLLRITNISINDASNITINIGTKSNPSISTLITSPITQSIAPESFIEIPVTLSFKRPTTDQKIKLHITMKDAITQETWSDYVVFNLSSKVAVPIYFSGHTKNWQFANAYFIGSGRTLVPFSAAKLSANWPNHWRSMRIPYNIGQTYDVVFSNTTIDSNVAYGIGIGAPAPQPDVDIFSNAAWHESSPYSSSGGDNLFAGATKLKLFKSDVSYLHVGDIDHYQITFNAASTPYDPALVANPTLTGSGGLTGDGIDTIVSITTQGNTAYIETDTAGISWIRIFDFSNPLLPILLSSINIGNTFISNVDISGITLSVNASDGTHFYDITDKKNPVTQGIIPKTIGSPIITVTNVYTVTSKAFTGHQLSVYGPLPNPILQGSVDISPSANEYFKGIKKAGNAIYVALNAAGAYLIDVSNPNLPTSALLIALAKTGVSTADSIEIIGGKLIITGKKVISGIVATTFDITIPATPTPIGSAFNTALGVMGLGSIGDTIVSSISPFTLSKFLPTGFSDLTSISNENAGNHTFGFSSTYAYFIDKTTNANINVYQLK